MMRDNWKTRRSFDSLWQNRSINTVYYLNKKILHIFFLYTYVVTVDDNFQINIIFFYGQTRVMIYLFSAVLLCTEIC